MLHYLVRYDPAKPEENFLDFIPMRSSAPIVQCTTPPTSPESERRLTLSIGKKWWRTWSTGGRNLNSRNRDRFEPSDLSFGTLARRGFFFAHEFKSVPVIKPGDSPSSPGTHRTKYSMDAPSLHFPPLAALDVGEWLKRKFKTRL